MQNLHCLRPAMPRHRERHREARERGGSRSAWAGRRLAGLFLLSFPGGVWLRSRAHPGQGSSKQGHPLEARGKRCSLEGGQQGASGVCGAGEPPTLPSPQPQLLQGYLTGIPPSAPGAWPTTTQGALWPGGNHAGRPSCLFTI